MWGILIFDKLSSASFGVVIRYLKLCLTKYIAITSNHGDGYGGNYGSGNFGKYRFQLFNVKVII